MVLILGRLLALGAVCVALACTKPDEPVVAAHAALYEPIAAGGDVVTHVLPPSTDTIRIDASMSVLSVGATVDLLSDTGMVFGRPVDVVQSSDSSQVLVLDALERRVRVLTLRGESVTEFGQRGRGPGDFEMPAALAFLDSATLCVWDPPLQRLTYLSSGGEFLGSMSLPIGNSPALGSLSTLGLNGKRVVPWLGALVAEVHSDPLRVDIAAQRAYLLRVDRQGTVLDTLFTVRTAPVIATQRREGSAVYTDWTRPLIFSPRLHWAPLDTGRIALATGGRFEIVVIDSTGQPVSRVVRETTPEVVSHADRVRFFEGEVEGRRAWAPPAVLARMFGGRFASVRPSITELVSTDGGAVWIRGFDTLGDPTGRGPVYEIVHPDGRRPIAVHFPYGESVLRVFGNRVYTVRRDRNGAESLVVYRLPIESPS